MHTIQGLDKGLGPPLGRGGAGPRRAPVHLSLSRRLEVWLRAVMQAVGVKGAVKGAPRGAGMGLPWGGGETRGPWQTPGGA